MRPVLRPGLRLLRRDRSALQLGFDWPGLATIPATRVVRAVLGGIDGFRDADGVVLAASADGFGRRECEEALAMLLESGAVVDGDAARDHDVAEQTWASWSLLSGPHGRAADIARSRRGRTIGVVGSGLVADEVRRLLPLSHTRRTDDEAEADALVVATDDEPPRSLSDAAMQAGRPHLFACVRDLIGVVGPFVVPGHTACLRCVDAARDDRDPAWSTLLAAAAARPLRVPAADPVIAALVGAWAAHEVALWASDVQPSTWGHVQEIPYGTGATERTGYELHPQCGCALFDQQDTMET